METGSTTAGAPEWQRYECSYGVQGGAKKAALRASAGGTGNEGNVTGVVMACRGACALVRARLTAALKGRPALWRGQRRPAPARCIRR